MVPNSLKMECARCQVAASCPKRGSSPLSFGKHKISCQLIGGYGRTPISPDSLSEESAARAEADGRCLTIANVPVLSDGRVTVELTKVFHSPVRHERETTTMKVDVMIPRGGGGT